MNLEAIADGFWDETDLASIFPRNVEQALALKLPVDVVKLSVVTVRTVTNWLRQRRFVCAEFPDNGSDLMGCLYAEKGHGFIFLCGADSAVEQRFTVAHDTAHFIVDYWNPRQSVIAALGPEIEEVLDGIRPARAKERAAAILSRVRLGAHWHLLPRSGMDAESDPRIAHVEDRADALGLELVAPRRAILSFLASQCKGMIAENAADRLGEFFGLPSYVFEPFVSGFCQRRTPSFLEEARRILKR